MTEVEVSIGSQGLNLSGISRNYSNLVLRVVFALTGGTNSPCLNAWKFTYASPQWPFFTFTVRVDGRGADPCGALPFPNVASISTTTPEIRTDNNAASYKMSTRLTDLIVDCSVNKAAALPSETILHTIAWSVTRRVHQCDRA